MITLTQYENRSYRALHIRSAQITAITEADNNDLAWHPLTLVECKSRRYYVMEAPNEIEDLIKEQSTSAEEKKKSASARIKMWQDEEAAWNQKKQETQDAQAAQIKKQQEAQAAQAQKQKDDADAAWANKGLKEKAGEILILHGIKIVTVGVVVVVGVAGFLAALANRRYNNQ